MAGVVWETIAKYSIPKLRTKLREIELNQQQIESKKTEDGYDIAALMWMRLLRGIKGFIISDMEGHKYRCAQLMRVAVEC